MIKNFDTIKQQLSELSSVINSFKSEAVQLRIVELILGARPTAEIEATAEAPTQHHAGKRRSTSRKPRASSAQPNSEAVSDARRRASTGSGPVATVAQLAEGAFFAKARTINDILEHCQSALARRFKANEISSKLGRMVRSGELTRQKNADGQYEYKKP